MNCLYDETSCTQFVVKPSLVEGWINQVDDQDYGPFLSRDLALRLAVADVIHRRKSGCPVRLVVEDSRGTVCAERCICAKFGR